MKMAETHKSFQRQRFRNAARLWNRERIMKRKRLTVVCWLAACLLSFPAQAEQIEFVLIGNGGIGLLPSNVTPPTSSTGFGGEGDIGIIFDTGTNDLTIDIEWGSANCYGYFTG